MRTARPADIHGEVTYRLRITSAVLLYAAVAMLGTSDVAAQSRRAIRAGSEPTSRNLEAVASRIHAGRCNLLLVGDSIATHLALDGRGTWVTGIWRSWRPLAWRGRFVPTTLHGVAVNGTRVDDGGQSPAFDPACELRAANLRPGQSVDDTVDSGWWGIPINVFRTTGDLGDRRLYRVELPAAAEGRDYWARYRSDPTWAEGPLRGTYLPILDPDSVSRFFLVAGESDGIDVDLTDQRPASGFALGALSIDFDHASKTDAGESVALELRTDPSHFEPAGRSLAMLGAVIERRDRDVGLLIGAHAVGGDTTKSHLDEGEWLPSGDGGFLRRYEDEYLVEFIERVEWNTFVVTLGTNDLKSYFRTPTETAARLAAVVDRYRDAANEARRRRTSILEPRFLVISPATAEDPEFGPEFAGLDAAIGALAGGDVAVVHLHRLLVDELGIGSSHQPELLVDPAHPDEVGAMLNAELVWNEIERSLHGSSVAAGPLRRVPNEYATIAEAAIDAQPDDVILVAPGEHVGAAVVATGDLEIRGSAGAEATEFRSVGPEPILRIDAASESPVRLRGLTLSGGRGADGGGMRSDACPLVIERCRVRDCVATGHGGAIRTGSRSLVLRDVAIEDCAAGGDGGAISVVDGPLVVEGLWIRRCEASASGGAIDAGDATAALSDVLLEDNLATDGGALAGASSSLTVVGSSFLRNSSRGTGGALHVTGSIAVSECTFEGNTSLGDGGAIRLDTPLASTFEQSTFVDSACGGVGGVIAASGGGSTSWRGVTVRTGLADVAGGGVHLDCHDLLVATSEFENLHAPACGFASIACGTLVIEASILCPDSLDICGEYEDLGGVEYPSQCGGLCEGDINQDGVRDGGDLGFLIAAWGECPVASFCRADLNRDGAVGGDDLGRLLSLLGPPCTAP